MINSLFEGCDESCGYLAAACAICAWGSFGVPLKFAKMHQNQQHQQQQQLSSVATAQPEVNFFVMQSYKTVTCFLTCWLVLGMGEKFQFSPWGLLSGLFWVPAGSCGVYAIRTAGLAVAVGTWSSIQVLTSFIFGILIFHEEVKSLERASMAFGLLIMGLVGMAHFAGKGTVNPLDSPPSLFNNHPLTEHLLDSTSNHFSNPASSHGTPSKDMQPTAGTRPPSPTVCGVVRKTIRNTFLEIESTPMESPLIQIYAPSGNIKSSNSDLDDEERVLRGSRSLAKEKWPEYKDYVVLCGGRLVLTKKQLGILGAVVNGAWGGCSLIPLHFARRDQGLSGAGYLISYGIGSAIVNAAMWILLFLYHCYSKQRFRDALNALPKWHFQQLWWPGFLAGLLHSLGNFGSILAVTYLGQATGYSMCQLQLIVSGLWGVFWFREIRGTSVILRWFLSALCAMTGIIWLSWEHKSSALH